MRLSLLELHQISKAFPGVQALANVDLDIHSGEIHALVGENGAGKSTLLGVASGRLKPDSGTLILQEKPIQLHGPDDGRRHGIAVIHQEAELFPDLSVAEWMALLSSGLPTQWGIINWREANQRARKAIQTMGDSIPVTKVGMELTAAERQVVEIATAYSQRLKILFLDEPTTSLTQREVSQLYTILADLKQQGLGIVYVSHRLSEVFDLSDRITVLRDGQVAARFITSDTHEDEVVAAMVGRQVDHFFPKTIRPLGEVLFASHGLSDRNSGGIHFELRKGEVLGVYGLIGAGRSEWAQTVIGLRPAQRGNIELHGQDIQFHDPGEALAHGVVYLPEDRHVMGLFGDLSVETNTTVATLRQHCTGPFIRAGEVRENAETGLQKLNTKMTGLDTPVSTLSGGNQQKVILTRWLLAEPDVLILDEPTRGIDVGAKAEVHRLIDDLAGQEKAVVLISSELPEVMGMSDRILVVRDGESVAEFERGRWTEDQIATAALPLERPREDETSLGAVETVSPNPLRQSFRTSWMVRRETLLAVVIGILSTGLTLAAPDRFLTWQNLSDVLLNVTPKTLAAVGMTFVIVAGGIDISIGSLLAICASVAGLISKQYDGILAPLCAGVGVGLLGGSLNGALALAWRLHPILVTLGTMSVFRGLVILITEGTWIQDLPPGFTWLGKEVWVLPYPVWIMLVVAVLGHIWGGWTKPGRLVYAIGSNPRAAATIGLPIKRVQFLTFVILGALVGLSAVLLDARFGQVQTNTGMGFELAVIAAVVVGGTNIMGGSGTVLGTVLASILLGLTANALVFLEISTFYDNIVTGALILIAVVGDGLLRRKEGWR